MKLIYYYSACIGIKTSDFSILCDPWFTQGVFGGTWYHFPYKEIEPKDIGYYDYIYISHIHPDHYDPIWLKKYLAIYTKTQLLIGNWNRKSSPLKSKMVRDGLSFLETNELSEKTSHVRIYPHDTSSASDIDSCICVFNNNELIVNMNDCIYDNNFYSYVSNSLKDLNYYSAQSIGLFSFTPAGPYPHTYWWGDDVALKEKSDNHKDKFLKDYLKKLSHFDTTYRIPFAGQYLLGGKASKFNDFRGACDAYEACKIDSGSIILKEWGEGVIDLSCNIISGERKEEFKVKEIKERVAQISNYQPDYTLIKYDKAFKDPTYLKRLCRISFKNALKHVKAEISYRYILKTETFFCCINLKDLSIDFKNRLVVGSDEIITHTIYMSEELLLSLLLCHEHWDNAEKGSMYMSHRVPDIFNRSAQSFLHFFSIE